MRSPNVIATYVEECKSIRTTQGAGGCFCLGFKNPNSPAAVLDFAGELNYPAAGGLKVAETNGDEWSGRVVERSEAPEVK